ncbi:XdhC family protein [Clostridium hydrogeniformans]|uniref:XdhC family protein n=1 Tax=Clostridium hydrogeniformans TaxID=349933 RepID=UPI0004801A28|nr:XdhC/CoxI family protein [Clostridium hydrogeniformans]
MEDMMLKEIYNKLQEGESVAMVTLTETIGSTSGKQGFTMAVFEDGSIKGTVGGGSFEYRIIQKASKNLQLGKDETFEEKISENTNGLELGGSAKGFIKIFKPRPSLIICGGGHVGFSLYNIANTIGFNVTVIDDRKEFANKDRFKNAYEVLCGDFYEKVSSIKITKNTYMVIASSGFNGDYETLKAVINKDVPYIGVVGSRKKWTTLKEKLLKDNITKEDTLEKVYAPIGLNLSSPSAEEVAFSALAEILLIKNRGTLEHIKDIRGGE